MPIGATYFLNNDLILTFGKWAILLILLVYAIFALIIIRQVDLMSKTLITNLSPVVRLLAIIHAILAIGLLFLAWRIL